MLNTFRSSKSNVFFWIVIGLLIVGLAGFGIGSSGGGGAATELAAVGEHPITVNEYANGLNAEQQRFAAGFGRAPEVSEIDGISARTLSQLLAVASLDGEAARLGLSVGDTRVREALMATAAFSDASGSFDTTAYEFALQNANLTPAEYDEIVRTDTTRALFEAGIAGGLAYPDTAARALVSFIGQRRELAWTRLNAENLPEAVGEASADDLAGFHEDNAAIYTLPERRDITYAYVTEDLLLDEAAPSEAELRSVYEERQDSYQSPERRIVDRIVFPDAAQAQAALGQIEDGSAGFDDIVAERGLEPGDVDLGAIAREDVSDNARELLFASTQIGVMGPVETSLGPALFRVNAVLEASTISFDEAREELSEELGRASADRMINEEFGLIEDLLAGGATLEEVADETLMDLGSITFSPDVADGIAADAAFRDEALAAEVDEYREVADLSDGIFVLRVNEIIAPELQPLSEIEDKVKEDWRISQIQSGLAAFADTLVEQLTDGSTLADVATEHNLIVTEEPPLNRRDIVQGTPPSFVEALFETDEKNAFHVSDGDTVLLGVVGDIVDADPADEELAGSLAFANRDFAVSASEDVQSLFIRAIQDESGVSVNQSLVQQVNEQIFGLYP